MPTWGISAAPDSPGLGYLVLPALALNYLGQGALLMRDPAALANPFFHLFPDSWLLPTVVLATIALVIASQAVISGAFSLTKEAIQLGLLPRMRVQFTSAQAMGQIYLPAVNWVLLVAVLSWRCLALAARRRWRPPTALRSRSPCSSPRC